jgi:hypothetical protein
MTGVAQPAAAGAYVDTGQSLRGRADVRAGLRRLGKLGVFRYVPFAGLVDPSQVTAAELEELLADGLAVGWIMRVRLPGWLPRNADPEADARAAVAAAQAAGFAPGTTGWLDDEGMGDGATSSEAHHYQSAAAHVFAQEGFRAGLYDGYSQPETGAKLYAIHDVTSYWTDLAHRVIPVRGTAIQQGPAFQVAGVPFDEDRLGPDLLGDVPYMTVAG